MVHHEELVSVLRFLRDGKAYGDGYDAVATLVWLSPAEVEIRAFHGAMTRPMFRELLAWFSEHGIESVKAARMGRHRLPGAVLGADGFWHLGVREFIWRWARTPPPTEKDRNG